MRHFRPFLLEHQITEQQWRVLRVLAEEGPMDFSKVAKQACLLQPSLTRISKSLIDSELIEAQEHPDDKRRSLLKISSRGQDILATMLPRSKEISTALEKKIGSKNFQNLLMQLDKVLQELDD